MGEKVSAWRSKDGELHKSKDACDKYETETLRKKTIDQLHGFLNGLSDTDYVEKEVSKSIVDNAKKVLDILFPIYSVDLETGKACPVIQISFKEIMDAGGTIDRKAEDNSFTLKVRAPKNSELDTKLNQLLNSQINDPGIITIMSNDETNLQAMKDIIESGKIDPNSKHRIRFPETYGENGGLDAL